MKFPFENVSDSDLCFIDTETTSLNPHTRVAWEVALIRVTPEGDVKRKVFQVELTNRETAQADPESLEICGFDDRYDPLEAHSRQDAARFIREFTDDAIVLGMVPDFDTLGLQNILDYVGDLGQWYYQLVDVDNVAFGMLRALGYDLSLPVDTDAVLGILGINAEDYEKHTALGDAELTMDYFYAVLNFPIRTGHLVAAE